MSIGAATPKKIFLANFGFFPSPQRGVVPLNKFTTLKLILQPAPKKYCQIVMQPTDFNKKDFSLPGNARDSLDSIVSIMNMLPN